MDFLLIAVPLSYFALKKETNFLKLLGIKKIPVKELIIKSLQIFAVLFIASIALSYLFNLINLNDLNKVTEKVLQLRQGTQAILIYLLIARVLTEEIFFRGFLAPRIGAIYSSIIFALFHFAYGSIAEMLGAFILGLILAAAFQKNKNLLPNIGAHWIYNLVAVTLM
ncbi:MAG TPA: type II CAAX endopeptidase family protein [archaeon]|nr:type II CAAX endopeptidase family protein [archaeon]